MDPRKRLAESARRASLEARSVAAMHRAGAVGVESPRRTRQTVKALRDYGPFGAAPRIAAMRHGEHPAIADERGEITFAELDDTINRLANALRAQGFGAGRSARHPVPQPPRALIAAFAASRVGHERASG